MWLIEVGSGLHQGSRYALKTGPNRLGSSEYSDIILLDDVIPETLLELTVADNGTIQCDQAASGLSFSYDGIVWSQARTETLFSVDLRYKVGDVQFVCLRLAGSVDGLSRDEAAVSDAGDGQGNDQVNSHKGSTLSADASNIPSVPQTRLHQLSRSCRLFLSRWFDAVESRWPRLRVLRRSLLIRFIERHALPALCGLSVILIILPLGLSTAFALRDPHSGSDGLRQPFQHPSGLVLSYQLSMGHQPPLSPEEPGSRTPLLSAAPGMSSLVTEAAGQDVTEPADAGPAMRLSYSLSFGKPLDMAEKSAEPALLDLREQLARHAWSGRVTINAIGKNLTLRGQLSEAERREFERILQRNVREFGQDLAFKATIEPLEPVPDLQIKQVLGGLNPVIVLQDGSRLIPGSLFDGRVVESITTDRIVLRGKDRIEIPI